MNSKTLPPRDSLVKLIMSAYARGKVILQQRKDQTARQVQSEKQKNDSSKEVNR